MLRRLERAESTAVLIGSTTLRARNPVLQGILHRARLQWLRSCGWFGRQIAHRDVRMRRTAPALEMAGFLRWRRWRCGRGTRKDVPRATMPSNTRRCREAAGVSRSGALCPDKQTAQVMPRRLRWRTRRQADADRAAQLAQVQCQQTIQLGDLAARNCNADIAPTRYLGPWKHALKAWSCPRGSAGKGFGDARNEPGSCGMVGHGRRARRGERGAWPARRAFVSEDGRRGDSSSRASSVWAISLRGDATVAGTELPRRR